MSFDIIHQCRFKYLCAICCMFASNDLLTTFHIFFIPLSSICLTLSLVIVGKKELPILCRVSFSPFNQTLFCSTICSLSEREHNMSSKDFDNFLLSKVLVVIFIR
ncbi:hypothetical protein HOG21_08025 [bacterium]|nr:hypothetical protein [bacterium]